MPVVIGAQKVLTVNFEFIKQSGGRGRDKLRREHVACAPHGKLLREIIAVNAEQSVRNAAERGDGKLDRLSFLHSADRRAERGVI